MWMTQETNRCLSGVLVGAGFAASLVCGTVTRAWSSSTYEEVLIDQAAPVEWGSNGYYSLAVHPSTGRPMLATSTASGRGVVLMTFDGSAWLGEEVGGADSEIQGVSLAFDPGSGEPRVAFAPHTGGVRVAFRDGGVWRVESFAPLHDEPKYVHLLIPASGVVQVMYSAYPTSTSFKTSVFHAQRAAPGAYTVTDVDPTGYYAGYTAAAALNPDTGRVGVVYSYGGSTFTGVRYAEQSGSSWTRENLPSMSSYEVLALAYASRGGARVPHCLLTNSSQVCYKSGSWTIETPVASASRYLGITADPTTARPALAYMSSGGTGVGRFDGSAWTTEILGSFTYELPQCAQPLAILGSGDAVLAVYIKKSTPGINPEGWIKGIIKSGGAYVLGPLQEPWRKIGNQPSLVSGASDDEAWVAYLETVQGETRLAHIKGDAVAHQTIASYSGGGRATAILLPEGGDRPIVISDTGEGTKVALPAAGGTYSIESMETVAAVSTGAIDPVTGEVLVARHYNAMPIPLTAYTLYFSRRTAPGIYDSQVVLSYGFPSTEQFSGQPALVVEPATGRPRILVRTTSQGLRDCRYNGSAWSTSSMASSSAYNPSLGVDPDTGFARACYHYSTTVSGQPVQQVIYRAWNGSSWSASEVVVSIPGNSTTASLQARLVANPRSGVPTIVYSAMISGSGELHVAEKIGAEWRDQTLATSLPACGAIGGDFSPTGKGAFALYLPERQGVYGFIDLGLAPASSAWGLYR